MSKRDLHSIVDQIVDLPTLPQVVTAIMGLLDDPDSSAQDINKIMTRDPALAGKILKLTNSAFYCLPNRVSSISQAIVILGFNTVKSLAISASILDMFGDGQEHFNYEKFWMHSVGVATVANILAKKQPGVDPDAAFVVGLMHDIGKLVLDQYAPGEFQDILCLAREDQSSFCDAEKKVLGTSHSEIGYWVAHKWQFAEDVAQAILHHHDVAAAPAGESRKLAALCAFADYVCKMRKYGDSGSFERPSLSREAWMELVIEKENLPALVEVINSEMHKADTFLSMAK